MQLMDQVGTGVNIFTKYILFNDAWNKRQIDDNAIDTLALHETEACIKIDLS